MIYSIDGKIVNIDGNLFERKIKSLTFQVSGTHFPMSYLSRFNGGNNVVNGQEYMRFLSNSPNTATINYGDGNTVVKDFEENFMGYRLEYTTKSIPEIYQVPQHEFTDSNTGRRNIVIEFLKPLEINSIKTLFTLIEGSLPIELNLFKSINSIKYQVAYNVENIPDSFPKNITDFVLDRVMKNRITKINDSFFATKIQYFDFTSSFDLSDSISSNLFKINQLKNTLLSVSMPDCRIIDLPNSIIECSLTFLGILRNQFLEIPSQINEIDSLIHLQVGNLNFNFQNQNLPIWNNLLKLEILAIGGRNLNLQDIPNSWKFLFSLRQINLQTHLTDTTNRFNQFIDAMYELCTVNGSITNNSGVFLEYPNRFRNISWGDGSLSFTGTKQAPTGYVQDSNNGTPSNQGEKVYVLQNQYGHTITHA